MHDYIERLTLQDAKEVREKLITEGHDKAHIVLRGNLYHIYAGKDSPNGENISSGESGEFNRNINI